jgi:hypothetical protein
MTSHSRSAEQACARFSGLARGGSPLPLRIAQRLQAAELVQGCIGYCREPLSLHLNQSIKPRFRSNAERYMKIHAILLAANGLILASTASAQSAATPLLAATADWDIRSTGPHQPINDTKVEGGKAVEVQTTGTGGIWEVAAIHPVDGVIAKGDHVAASVWVKSTVPAKVVFRIETRVGAARVDDRFVEIGTDWSQQTLDFVATDNYPAGSTQVALLLNSGKQAVDLGPISLVDKGSK